MAAGAGMASSSSLWGVLGQASNVVQLVGVDALGLVSMVVQAALAARRHRDACVQLARHVEIVGGLLREVELAELMRREATRRPLEQLRGALRRCYALVTACQDCGYLRRLLLGALMADELRAAQREIDMFIRLIPLISLVETSARDRRLKAPELAGLNNITVRSNHCLRDRGSTRTENLEIEELMKLCAHTAETCPGFTKFELFQIMYATDNFSDKQKVGWGGFGSVYKGQLTEGRTVAIKRLDNHATTFDFNSELQLARLDHTNVVRLLGWCVDLKERILVYEFAHNGSLEHYIFDRTKRSLFGWSKRLNVIKGLAEGLVYLHKDSMLWIVHRDLKPYNMLLDYNMNLKIGDFGSSRALSSELAQERTSRVVGTRGYIPPEYASRGAYSLKTDVFSFGVLVLVIISGRKNTVLDTRGDTVGDLVRDAWHMWKEQRLHELIDPSIGLEYELAEIEQCARVALLCAQEDPADRPTMADAAAAMMNSESTSLSSMEPKQPTELSNGEDTASATSYEDHSSRTMDITITSSATVSTRVRIIVDLT